MIEHADGYVGGPQALITGVEVAMGNSNVDLSGDEREDSFMISGPERSCHTCCTVS